jgi:hypothetical protein
MVLIRHSQTRFTQSGTSLTGSTMPFKKTSLYVLLLFGCMYIILLQVDNRSTAHGNCADPPSRSTQNSTTKAEGPETTGKYRGFPDWLLLQLTEHTIVLKLLYILAYKLSLFSIIHLANNRLGL